MTAIIRPRIRPTDTIWEIEIEIMGTVQLIYVESIKTEKCDIALDMHSRGNLVPILEA